MRVLQGPWSCQSASFIMTEKLPENVRIGLTSRLLCFYSLCGKFFWTTRLCLRTLSGPRGGSGFTFLPGARPLPSAAFLISYLSEHSSFRGWCSLGLLNNRRRALSRGLGMLLHFLCVSVLTICFSSFHLCILHLKIILDFFSSKL